MLKFLKKSSENPPTEKKASFFSRLKTGLSRTRHTFSESLATLFLGKKNIDETILTEIETKLLMADVGVEATTQIIHDLTQKIARKQLHDAEALLLALKEELLRILKPCEQPLVIPEQTKPFVVLTLGVNGAGKTTTIGKLAHFYQQENKKIILAAGDTFRAAAVEQLKVWGDRNHITVIAQHTGADSASVIYDAMQSATARQADILFADTAGRLHTKENLMEELKKVSRVMKKLDETAPHEVLLVLDASTGQNALIQAQQFNEAMKITGIVLTKLDGTAKGGIIFAIAKKLNVPIRFIGVGEQKEDLQPFNAEQFMEALFEIQ
ncbi:MAG: signal recognition particle-docking protein FtsY [Gammaproteobacteria bacterium]|nr:signal recognition particle-docking protein FtsY [Gammaproteobacteria bacterium]